MDMSIKFSYNPNTSNFFNHSLFHFHLHFKLFSHNFIFFFIIIGHFPHHMENTYPSHLFHGIHSCHHCPHYFYKGIHIFYILRSLGSSMTSSSLHHYSNSCDGMSHDLSLELLLPIWLYEFEQKNLWLIFQSFKV